MLLASQPPSSGTVLTRICQAGLSPLCLPVLKGNREIFGSSESFGMRKSPPRHWFEMCHRTSCLFLVNSRWKLCLTFLSPLPTHFRMCNTENGRENSGILMWHWEQIGKGLCEAMMQVVGLQTEGRRDVLETIPEFQEIRFMSWCGITDGLNVANVTRGAKNVSNKTKPARLL